MKKLIVLVAAAMLFLPMSAMAGMTAFMDMEQVSDFELAETTGQTGLTVNVTAISTRTTWVSWGDDNGCVGGGTTLGLAASGVLYIVPITTLNLDTTITVDVCTSAGVTYLVVGVDELVLQNAISLGLGTGTVGIGNAAEALGTAAPGSADKLGILTVDAILNDITIMISAH